jgi:diguanylate cyclase (GGDEF)-like protein/PAS domain S-box-containing protein
MMEVGQVKDLNQTSLRDTKPQLAICRTVYDALPVGICLISHDFRLVSMNRQMAELTGGHLEGNVGRTLGEVVPSIAAQLEPHLRRALEGEPAAALELKGVQSDGRSEQGAYLVFLEPARDDDGRIVGVLCAALDITERKKVEEGLREQLHGLVTQATVGVAQTDLEGRFLFVNDRFCEIIGRSRAALLGVRMQDISGSEARLSNTALFKRLVATGEPFSIQKPYIKPDGSSVWVSNYVSVTRDSSGRPQTAVAIVQDITAAKLTETALRESEDHHRHFVELSPHIPWTADPLGKIVEISERGKIITGVPVEQLVGDGWLSILHPGDRSRLLEVWSETVRSAAPLDTEYRVRLANGDYRWFRARAMPRKDALDRVIRWYGTLEDVHERKLAEQQVAFMAYHDPLTDLANRRLFYQELDQALAGLSPGENLAVHCLDLDRFKGVNDTLGHAAGDTLLRQAADRLRACVPEGGVVARLGGDEFAIIQRYPRGPDDAAALARGIADVLDESYEINDHQAVAGASIGIAFVSSGQGTGAEELVRNADIALYRAKVEGRGTFRFFDDSMSEAVRREQQLRIGLRTALARGELELHYQPTVGIRTGELTCLEALLRWRHPDRGMISPAEFIPLAEETGRIVQIGEWALRTACREAARWPDAVRVAVNLSPVQFRNPGLLQAVAGALEDSGLPAARLELEITESLLLEDDPNNLKILRKLSELGARIAMDDFGSGFSSLAYLLRFPFDKIKIDRSFVVGLPDRMEAEAVIRALVSMSRSLSISVTAEGIETQEQLGALRRLGCDDGQGYLISRPVQSTDVMALIDRLCLRERSDSWLAPH